MPPTGTKTKMSLPAVNPLLVLLRPSSTSLPSFWFPHGHPSQMMTLPIVNSTITRTVTPAVVPFLQSLTPIQSRPLVPYSATAVPTCSQHTMQQDSMAPFHNLDTPHNDFIFSLSEGFFPLPHATYLTHLSQIITYPTRSSNPPPSCRIPLRVKFGPMHPSYPHYGQFLGNLVFIMQLVHSNCNLSTIFGQSHCVPFSTVESNPLTSIVACMV